MLQNRMLINRYATKPYAN